MKGVNVTHVTQTVAGMAEMTVFKEVTYQGIYVQLYIMSGKSA